MLLTACSSGADQAKQRYELLKQENASLADVCAAGRNWARAEAERGDGDRFSEANAIADVSCLTAEMKGGDRSYGLDYPVADNLDAMARNVDGASGDEK